MTRESAVDRYQTTNAEVLAGLIGGEVGIRFNNNGDALGDLAAAVLDKITRENTAFAIFDDLVVKHCPTLRYGKYAPKGMSRAQKADVALLADAYDMAQVLMGTKIRCSRG